MGGSFCTVQHYADVLQSNDVIAFNTERLSDRVEIVEGFDGDFRLVQRCR